MHPGKVLRSLDDIRGPAYAPLRSPDLRTGPACQRFGAKRIQRVFDLREIRVTPER